MDYSGHISSFNDNGIQRVENGNYSSQNDSMHNHMNPWSQYQMRLAYDAQKMQMSMYKQDITYQQRIAYEHAMQEQRIRYQNYLQLLSWSVYSDSNGNIIYAMTSPDKSQIVSKNLLNVENYRATIFKAFYPQVKSALQITWDSKSDNFLVFPFDSDGIEANLFLRKLKGKGVLLLVSGRMEKQAANALLAYSFNSAEQIEIPGRHGWNRMGDGSWHYAYSEEITFEEVSSGVCK